jgi:phosphatidylinositol-3-phosphatase
LLSPFIKPGSSSETAYNHYSLLRSLEEIFRIDEHLGYAADDAKMHYFLNTIGNDTNVFQQRR